MLKPEDLPSSDKVDFLDDQSQADLEAWRSEVAIGGGDYLSRPKREAIKRVELIAPVVGGLSAAEIVDRLNQPRKKKIKKNTRLPERSTKNRGL